MDKNTFIEILTNANLSEKEARVYIALLELNESFPSIIAKRANLKRPTTYVILEQLKKKGLVSHVKKNKNLYYRATEPKHFLEDQKAKFEKLKGIIPDLTKLNQKFESTPQMSIYQGRDGIIQIMEDTLTTKTEILCWVNAALADKILEDYHKRYVKRKIKKKIHLKGIFCYDEIALEDKKRSKEELREIYLIPKEKFPFKTEINIYDDKIAIISHEDEVGVIIQNQNIANTQRAIFNLGFEYAKILEKKLLSKADKKFLGMK